MTELGAEQSLTDRPAWGVARAVLIAAALGLSGCSILPGGDEPDVAEGAAEASGEETPPEFTPVAAAVPAESEVGRVTIVYPEGNADLPETVTAELDRLAEQVADRDDIRLELQAYAKGDDDEASRAKLFSLKRGMLVRSHLHKKGVAAQRVVLRPLGIEAAEGPPDRVDIVLLQGTDPASETRIAEAVPQSPTPTQPAFSPVQPEALPESAPAASEQTAGDEADAAAQQARLAQLQQGGGQGPLPAEDLQGGPEAAAAPDQVAEVQASSETAGAEEVAPVVIPQGDAPSDTEGEASLVARFEAIAAADVQLAEDPDLRATIARTGGVVSDPEQVIPEDLDDAEATQVAEAPVDGEAAFVSRFFRAADPSAPADPAEPQFDAATQPVEAGPPALEEVPEAPGDLATGDPAVSVASGDAFEAALAGTAPPSEAVAPSTEFGEEAAPEPELRSTLIQPQPQVQPAPSESAQPEPGPSLAALPPAGTMTTDPAAAGDGTRDLYLIQFVPDSPDMTAEGRSKLGEAIESIIARPDTRVRIVAHAEGAQDDEFLLALSTIRRNEVEGALRNSGVHWGRIWSKAVGDRKPSSARGDNNVVEIIIRPK